MLELLIQGNTKTLPIDSRIAWGFLGMETIGDKGAEMHLWTMGDGVGMRINLDITGRIQQVIEIPGPTGSELLLIYCYDFRSSRIVGLPVQYYTISPE